MRQVQRFDRYRLTHRAGDNWHALVEVTEQSTALAASESDSHARRIFRCDECDLEIIAAAELWQEGTMDW